jgi:transcriptional regulator with XRE-family HTH domain
MRNAADDPPSPLSDPGFGRQIVAARKRLAQTTGTPVTQARVAELIGVSASTLRHWERDENFPGRVHLRVLCHCLHLRGPFLRPATQSELDADEDWLKLAAVWGPDEADRMLRAWLWPPRTR